MPDAAGVVVGEPHRTGVVVPHALRGIGQGQGPGAGYQVPQPQEGHVTGPVVRDGYPAPHYGRTVTAVVRAPGAPGQRQVDGDLGPGLDRLLPGPVEGVGDHVGAGEHEIVGDQEARTGDDAVPALDADDSGGESRLGAIRGVGAARCAFRGRPAVVPVPAPRSVCHWAPTRINCAAAPQYRRPCPACRACSRSG